MIVAFSNRDLTNNKKSHKESRQITKPHSMSEINVCETQTSQSGRIVLWQPRFDQLAKSPPKMPAKLENQSSTLVFVDGGAPFDDQFAFASWRDGRRN